MHFVYGEFDTSSDNFTCLKYARANGCLLLQTRRIHSKSSKLKEAVQCLTLKSRYVSKKDDMVMEYSNKRKTLESIITVDKYKMSEKINK